MSEISAQCQQDFTQEVVGYVNKAHNETTSRISLDSSSDWMYYAKCTGMTHLFFGVPSERPNAKAIREELAKSICRTCFVVDVCLNYALANNEQGIWGGLNEEERYIRFNTTPYAPVNGKVFKKS
jgi:WhiB family transcriptional regulator, redox-sensing transcriptional regulator